MKRRPDSVPPSDVLRRIPSVDELLAAPRLLELAARLDRALIVDTARSVLADLRARATQENKSELGSLSSAELNDHLVNQILADVELLLRPSLRPVINATGVVLHTNLGRAPLSIEAADHIRAAATHYTNLEYDLEAGARGTRDVHTARLLARLAGAESAVVVNNNAAAVFLVLAALARGGEVIVSRGELIEIGDGFRIPDIMAESGAALREVGTTNRTRLADYERAINDRTRMLLRVHRSNFSMAGFTAQPSLAELVELGRRVSLPVYEDLGSGCLVDLSASGIAEPLVRESFAAGVSVASFSGDKLLGGPQAGIIAGRRDLVARIRRHPMFRALRVDKLTIAALEATLLAYLRGPGATAGHSAIPILTMIRAGTEEIAMRADKFLQLLRSTVPVNAARFEIRDSESVVGGGSTPGQQLPTRVIAIYSNKYSAAELEERLRRAPLGIPVIARVENGALILDLRTVFPDQESVLAESLASALTP
ncbi:MAG TPA: L-seryl-tRNA(Sec) selenium transferase [Candidatus Acidoferrales bacterium]|nr:L-seryl-tRNA(Sec) selenium transferase [Candidatus Acidoferrales bacterium]